MINSQTTRPESAAGRHPAAMTPASFTSWLESRSLNDSDAAALFGIHRHTIRAYREGKSKIPRMAALACAAISYGLPPVP